MILAILAYGFLFFCTLEIFSEHTSGNAISSPRKERIRLAIAVAGDILAVVSLTFRETWHPICMPAILLLILAGLPLMILQVRLLSLAVRLEQEGRLTPPKDMVPYHPNSRLNNDSYTYRYADGREGRSPVPFGVGKGYLNILYLPDNPRIHRMVRVDKAAALSGRLNAGQPKPPSTRRTSTPPPVMPATIAADESSLAAVVQRLIDAGGDHCAVLLHKRSGRCVQLLRSSEEGAGIVLDVPLLGLTEAEIQKTRACLAESLREVQSSDLSVLAVFNEDAEKIAGAALGILTRAFGLPLGTSLKVNVIF